MRLLNVDCNLEFKLVQGVPLCMFVESPRMLRFILNDLSAQTDGSAGSFILSKEGKELAISKSAVSILNPFQVSFNDKKLISKLYQEIEKTAVDDCFSETEELNSHIVRFLDLIVGKLPYRIEFDLGLDITALMKMYKVRLEEEFDAEFIAKISSYIKLIHKVCGIECFVTYNLKQLLMPDELEAFYRELVYEQIYLIDIEGTYSYKLPEESCIIIDKDECLISLD